MDQCIPFDQPCGNCTGDNCCYGDGKKCGDKCIYKFNGDYEKYDCNGVCVLKNQKCDKKCSSKPPTFECGLGSEAKCLPITDFELFRTCRESGKCLTNLEPCGDECHPDYIKCGDYCRKKTEYRDCNGICVPKHEQCDGNCPADTQACGQKYCLSTDSSEAYSTAHYRECNGVCIPMTEPCDRTCVMGYNFCNYTLTGNVCNTCKDCNNVSINYDKCIKEDMFEQVYKWCGDCNQCTLKSLPCPAHPNDSCPSPSLPPTECQSIRMEKGEAIKEESSYDPNTKELTISVPSHRGRMAAKFIIGERWCGTVYPQECLIYETPQYLLNLLNGAENSGDGCKETVELKESDLENHYVYNVIRGEMSKEEISKLPKSLQYACPEVCIWTTTVETNETTFKNNETVIEDPTGNCVDTTTTSPGCKSKVIFFINSFSNMIF